MLQLINEQKIKFDLIGQDIRDRFLSLHKGTLIIIYDSIVLVCRKGKNNLSILF